MNTINRVPYDIGNFPKEPFSLFMLLVICFAIAFVIALIVMGIMKGQLKSVQSRSEADGYMKSGGMKLTKKKDLFLYRHVEHREKTKDTDSNGLGNPTTHMSSSGTMHDGKNGKF